MKPSLTDRWLAPLRDVMPPLEGPEGTAERLLLLVHYGIDWDSWVARYRHLYWDQLLPDRIIVATYRQNTLRRWWADVSESLNSRPKSPEARAELEQLLRAESGPVLKALRFEVDALLLRTRLTADAVRSTKESS